jgi:hypothetical protein
MANICTCWLLPRRSKCLQETGICQKHTFGGKAPEDVSYLPLPLEPWDNGFESHPVMVSCPNFCVCMLSSVNSGTATS